MRSTRLPYEFLLAVLLLAGAAPLSPAARMLAQQRGGETTPESTASPVFIGTPVFTGNAHVSSDILSEALRDRGLLPYPAASDAATAAAVVGILQQVYAARGYPFCRVAVDVAAAHGHPSPDTTMKRSPQNDREIPGDAGSRSVRIRISEGPLLVVGAVAFEGDTGLSDAALRETMRLQQDEPFTDRALEQDIERLLALYDRSGYPFAAVRVADITVRTDESEAAGNEVLGSEAMGSEAVSSEAVSSEAAGQEAVDNRSTAKHAAAAAADTVRADITLAIESGGLFRIEEFTVEGNELTDADVIVRETRIQRGEVYDAEAVTDVRRRLARLDYFSSVDEPRLYVRDGRGGLLLRVTEGNANLFDGVVGYQPPAGDESEGYFTGLVNLSFRNLFGTGRRLDARWERATRQVSELELHYLEPWLFGLPLNAAGGFFQRQQDSAYVRRALDGEIRYLATTDLQFAATVQSTQVIPSENSTVAGLRRSSMLAGGVELRIDTRDDVWSPRAGILLRNSYSGGDKRFTADDGREVTDFQQRIEIDAGYFQELFARTVLAVSLHGRELRGDELDVSDLYRVGGANTLRGYREEQFAGTRFGWMNTELRYSLGRRTFAFLFYDFGYIYQSPDTDRGRDEFSAFRGGYGIGGRIETALGIMGVSYALGQGDGFADGKIHFGLINAF